MSEQAGAPRKRVLIVDDEPAMRETLSVLFRRESYEVVTAAGCVAASQLIRGAEPPFLVVLTDMKMPDGDGFQVLEAAKARSAASEVIVMTAYHEHAFDAMRRGAYDFVAKPFPSLREVLERVEKAHEKATIVAENLALRAQVTAAAPEAKGRPLVARCRAMRTVVDIVDKIAAAKTTVLLTGESGTGKERIARLLHERSDRARCPFVVVNCGALPEALMESELFGHEKGAFTGASAKHHGLLHEADGGTLMLDEIGELPVALQVKLLRVLQEKKVRPVGGTTETTVDVRIVAATNRQIDELVAQGSFRRDLYYRLNVIRIEVPPLRERRDDLAPLVEVFVRRFATELGKPVAGVSKDAFRALAGYRFPGNVRELENIIERAVVLADGPVLEVADLPEEVAGVSGQVGQPGFDLPPDGCDLPQVLDGLERRLILQALERSGLVRKSAAVLLGISFRSLRYRVAKLGIEVALESQEQPSADEEPAEGIDGGADGP